MEKITAQSKIRKKIVDLVSNSKEGHLASSFSIVEILISIFDDMQHKGGIKPENLILSKGHASYAYYATLSHFNLFTKEELLNVGEVGSKFYGHLPYIKNDNRFQFGSGSLGHGFPYAVGLAKAREMLGIKDTIYCVIGDGEANEGTFWESLLICSKFKNINLKILVDSNDSSERAIPIKKMINNLELISNDLTFSKCDGHNLLEIKKCLKSKSKINLIICNTIKGYPVNFMQNNPIWHHKIPNSEDINKIMSYLV